MYYQMDLVCHKHLTDFPGGIITNCSIINLTFPDDNHGSLQMMEKTRNFMR
jgi:hypothetical protein